MSASLRIFNAIRQSRNRIAQTTSAFQLPSVNFPVTSKFAGRLPQSGK